MMSCTPRSAMTSGTPDLQISGTPDSSSDMADDVRLDYEDLASRVCELVSRPAWTEEQMRRYARRQAREVGESSSSPLGQVFTVSSLDSISSVDDDSRSVCENSISTEDRDRTLMLRTNMVMGDYADYVSYVDKSRSPAEDIGDKSILRRIRRASTSSAGQDPISEWRHEPIEPIRRQRRSSDIESCAGIFEDVEMNEDEFSSDFEGTRFAARDVLLRERTNMVMGDYADYVSYVDKSRSSVEELVGDKSILRRIRRASTSSAGQDPISEWRHEPIEPIEPIRGQRRSSDIESCAGIFEDVEMSEERFSSDFEGARFAARDVLTRVDSARQSRHERNDCRGGNSVFLVLFGVVLGILMSVSFGESMRRRETSASQRNESLPGGSFGRTRARPPRPPWSIAKLMSSVMPSIRDETREKYDPRWYEFHGTYSDSFSFCSRQEARIPCPYSVYCPDGRGSASALQYEGDPPYDATDRAHVPIIDVPFGWARLGVALEGDGTISEDTCSVRIETEIEASEVFSHLLCCREAPPPGESEVKSNFLHGNIELREYGESDNQRDDRDDLLRQRLDPVWFDSRHGWHGKFGGASVLFSLWSFSDL